MLAKSVPSSEYMPIIYQVVTWVLVILGWLIVWMTQKIHIRRTECRSKLNGCVKKMNELEELAIEYHCASSADVKQARQIKTRIEQLLFSIRNTNLLNPDDYSRVGCDIRQSITLDNFDSTNHKSQQMDSTIVQGIGGASRQVEEYLEAAFNKKYD